MVRKKFAFLSSRRLPGTTPTSFCAETLISNIKSLFLLLFLFLSFQNIAFSQDRLHIDDDLLKLNVLSMTEAEIPNGMEVKISIDEGQITFAHTVLPSISLENPENIDFDALKREFKELKAIDPTLKFVMTVPQKNGGQEHRSLVDYVESAKTHLGEENVFLVPDPLPVTQSTPKELRRGLIMATVAGVRSLVIWTMMSGSVAAAKAAADGQELFQLFFTGAEFTYASFRNMLPVLIATAASAVFAYIAVKRRILLSYIFRNWFVKTDDIVNFFGRTRSPAVGKVLAGLKIFSMGMILNMVTASAYFIAGDLLNRADPTLMSFNETFKPFLFDAMGNIEIKPWFMLQKMAMASFLFNMMSMSLHAVTKEEGRGTFQRLTANRVHFTIFFALNVLMAFYYVDIFPHLIQPILYSFAGLGLVSMLIPWHHLKYQLFGGEVRLDHQGKMVLRSRRVMGEGHVESNGMTLAGLQRNTYRYHLAPEAGANETLHPALRYDTHNKKWIVQFQLKGQAIDVIGGSLKVRNPGQGEPVHYAGYKLEEGYIVPITQDEGYKLWKMLSLDVNRRMQDLEVLVPDSKSFLKRFRNLIRHARGKGPYTLKYQAESKYCIK